MRIALLAGSVGVLAVSAGPALVRADSFRLNTIDLGGFPGGNGAPIISTAGFYYQNPLGNNFPPPSASVDAFPELEFDSYVAIDPVGASTSLYTAAAPPFTVPGYGATFGFFDGVSELQGGWGAMPGVLSGDGSAPDGRDGVFIARLTILKTEQLIGKAVVVDITGVAPGASSGVFVLPLEQIALGGPEYSAGAYRRQSVVLNFPAAGVETGVAEFDVYDVYIVRNQPPCPGDTNGDHEVDMLDLNTVLAGWQQTGVPGDVAPPGGDGVVNFDDLNAVLTFWQQSCP